MFETVRAEVLPDRRFRLLGSPFLVNGLADGDVVERAAYYTHIFDKAVPSKWISVGLTIGASYCSAMDALLPMVQQYNGGVEGRIEVEGLQVILLTIPATAGEPAIKSLQTFLQGMWPECTVEVSSAAME